MQNFYDKDKYVVQDEYDKITKIQTIHVTPLFVPQNCPHCDHPELIKNPQKSEQLWMLSVGNLLKLFSISDGINVNIAGLRLSLKGLTKEISSPHKNLRSLLLKQ